MPRRNLILLLVAVLMSWLCYQRASRNRYAGTLAEAMNLVTTRYINEVEPRVLFEGAMKGMVAKLDPNSTYTGPDEFDQFQQQMDGKITGIGILIEADDQAGHLKVLDALIGKPAHAAGLRAGDLILAIDGQPTEKMPQREAVRLIRGREGTKVKLLVRHEGRDEPVEHEVTRATIPVESVLGDARRASGAWEFRLVDHPRLGYLRITSFGERTADEFRAALASYGQSGEAIDGLILDLRGNPGGLLPAAVAVCDALLDEGVIVTTRGRGGVIEDQYTAKRGSELPAELPIAVLVDQLSASASEIVAACLQDHRRAAVVGQRTWGKGTVQNVIEIEGGRSALRLTTGSYHRPSGKEIHKWKSSQESDDWGVRPDEGLDVPLTNHQSDLIALARRKRDLVPWEELKSAPAAKGAAPDLPAAFGDSETAIPTPVADAEDPVTDKRAALEAEAAGIAPRDPALIDPQLRRAIEYLQQQIGQRPSQPGRA